MNWAALGCLHGFLLHGRTIAISAAGQQDEMGEAATMQRDPAASAEGFNRFMSIPQRLWESLLVTHQGMVLEILKNKTKKTPQHQDFCSRSFGLQNQQFLAASETCFARLSKRFSRTPRWTPACQLHHRFNFRTSE